MSRLKLVFAVLPILLMTACTSYITVQSRRPGAVNVGSLDTLVMLDGEGRRSATEFVAQELPRMARESGYFRIVDKSESGITLSLAGRTATVENATEEIEENAAYLKVDVLDWSSDKSSNTSTNSKGQQTTVTTINAQVVLAVTLAGPDGKAILAEKDYEGTSSSSSKDITKDDVIEAAGKNAIAQLLADITPITVKSRVRIDDSDKAQKPFIKTAEAGNFSQAVDDLKGYIGMNENSASAYYNLGVFLDAMGNYGEAMGAYDKAIELSGGSIDYYSSARAECARRQADLEALSN